MKHFEEREIPLDVQMMTGGDIVKSWRLKRAPRAARFILCRDMKMRIVGRVDDLKWGELCEIRRLAREAGATE